MFTKNSPFWTRIQKVFSDGPIIHKNSNVALTGLFASSRPKEPSMERRRARKIIGHYVDNVRFLRHRNRQESSSRVHTTRLMKTVEISMA